METVIDWSKAPSHATHWCPGNARIAAGWIYHNGGGEFYSCYADKGLEHIPCFPAWRALRMIPRPAEITKWTGEGMPSLGVHVFVHDDGSLVYGHGESGEVIAHVEGCAVIRMSYGLGCFLPRCLRTAEQIAAEARQEGIEELGNFISLNAQVPTPYLWEVAQKIYDAGYRKQAQP